MNEVPLDNESEFETKEEKKDRSLLYLGLILGSIILAMAYLTFFVEDVSTLFNKKETVALEVTPSAQLDESMSRDDSEIRKSLVKFIEAFYYDQKRGYFDPPSYFATRIETYYNFHNLTYPRLREIHQKRISEKSNLQQNWIVSSLDFDHDEDKRLRATYLVKEDYLNTLKNAYESADVKYEMVIDEHGKIVSLREVEVRNFSSVKVEDPLEDSLSLGDELEELAVEGSLIPEAGKVKHAETGGRYEGRVYDLGTVETAPEFPGGQRKLLRLIKKNINYPAKARVNKIEGRVYVSFVVERNGDINGIQVIRGIGGGCDEEAIRVLRTTAPWQPGTIGGKPVRTAYTLPIKFKL